MGRSRYRSPQPAPRGGLEVEFGIRRFSANRKSCSRLVWGDENSVFRDRYSPRHGGKHSSHQFISQPRADFCPAPDCVASPDEQQLPCARTIWVAETREATKMKTDSGYNVEDADARVSLQHPQLA